MESGARITFDSEKAMEDYLHAWSFLPWFEWPKLPDGCEWRPGDIGESDVFRQVRLKRCDGTDTGSIVDMVFLRWFRTPTMPEGKFLGCCTMLVELKNDVITHAHIDQVLRYFEEFELEPPNGIDHPSLVCCALVGTGIRPDLLRIARAIPFLQVMEWAIQGADVWLPSASPIPVARPARIGVVAEVVGRSGSQNGSEPHLSIVPPAQPEMTDAEFKRRHDALTERLKLCAPSAEPEEFEAILAEKYELLRERRRRVLSGKCGEVK